MSHHVLPARGVKLIAWASAIFLASAGSGCQTVRATADRGQRILDTPTTRPAQVLAFIGAIPGIAAAVPFTLALLPTVPLQDARCGCFRYHSSPDHDIPLTVAFAPIEIGAGLTAFIVSSPFLLANPRLGDPGEPSEWPPPRSWSTYEPSPGEPGSPSEIQAPPAPRPSAPSLPPPSETNPPGRAGSPGASGSSPAAGSTPSAGGPAAPPPSPPPAPPAPGAQTGSGA